MQIEEGVARLSVGYTLKVPMDVQFATQDNHAGISLEFPVTGDTEAVKAQLEVLEAELATLTKLMVFAQLGVEFTEVKEGVLAPKLTAPRREGGTSGGGGGFKPSNQTPPKAGADLTATLPRHTVVLDGQAVELLDLRPLKASGVYKPNAADFRVVGGKQQFWLQTKEGAANLSVISWLVSEGIEV